MSSSLKSTIEKAIRPDSPYLRLLQERGLVRRELAPEELLSEAVRGDAVEQAMILFALRERQERQEILKALAGDGQESVKVAAFKGVGQRAPTENTLKLLDVTARDLWNRAVRPVRERATELSRTVSKADLAIDAKDYETAQSLLDTATDVQRALEVKFQTAYSEARRALRREYNHAFSSRVWDEVATKHFDTIVNRSVFVPPDEMRASTNELSEVKQRFVADKQYATELEKRVRVRPERNLSPSMKP